MSLVVDANVAVAACASEQGIVAILGSAEELMAPPLMWAEARSTLHHGLARGRLSRSDADLMHERLYGLGVDQRDPRELGAEVWRIGDELGWGRTYDAEYLALARLLGGRVVTLDGRLRRGADRTGLVVAPTEL